MHKGARDALFLSFAKFRKFLFSSTTLVSFFFFFHLFVSTSISTLWADFAMCQVVLAVYLVYLSYFTLFYLCDYYKNKYLYTFIIWHVSFSMKTLNSNSILFYGPTLLWAESVMGRVCYGPRCHGTLTCNMRNKFATAHVCVYRAV